MKTTEPLVKEIKRINREADAAFKKTALYEVQQLLEKRAFWRRRQTIASNKIADIDDKLGSLATRLANELGADRRGPLDR